MLKLLSNPLLSWVCQWYEYWYWQLHPNLWLKTSESVSMSSSVGVCHRVCVQYMNSWLPHAHTCTCILLLALSQQWMCVKDGWILHSTSQNTKLQGSLLVDNPLFSARTWFQNTALVAHQQNPAIIWYNSVGNHHWSNKEYLNWRNEHSEPYETSTSKIRINSWKKFHWKRFSLTTQSATISCCHL